MHTTSPMEWRLKTACAALVVHGLDLGSPFITLQKLLFMYENRDTRSVPALINPS